MSRTASRTRRKQLKSRLSTRERWAIYIGSALLLGILGLVRWGTLPSPAD